MSFNQSGTFVYTPDISVVISTIKDGVIDVSADVMNFQMDREINQTSTFTMTLNNPRRKYNRKLNTMDRITVFLKRTGYIQCFTGLITYAPIETLVPTPVTVTAMCTLYILQQTYWDDTLIQYQSLLLNYMDQTVASSDQTYGDGGIAQAIVNVLTQVCGWNPSAIHIQGIPQNFINFAAGAFTNNLGPNTEIDQGSINEIKKIVSADGVAAGKTLSSNSTSFAGNKTAAYLNPPDGGVGVSINASKVVAFQTSSIAGNLANFPGPNALNPVDIKQINENIFYCSAPFSYINSTDKKIVNNAVSWLAHNPDKKTYDGRLLLLTNQRTQRVVAVRATSVPQKVNTQSKGQAVYDPSINYFQCHPGVVAYLNGTIGDPTAWSSSNSNPSAGTAANVTFEWADSSKITVGLQPELTKSNANSYYAEHAPTTTTQSTPASLVNALNKLVYNLVGQLGDKYTENYGQVTGPLRISPGAYGSKTGSFDCSGLAYWAYSTIGITLGTGSNTAGECGPIDGSQSQTYGQWIPNVQRPQTGDLIFWEVPGDGGPTPQHVTIMVSDFNGKAPAGTIYEGQAPDSDVAYVIESSHPGGPPNASINSPAYLGKDNAGPNIQKIYWSKISGGQWQNWGGRFIGARRPITLHHGWGQYAKQNYNPTISTNNTNSYNTPNSTVKPYNPTISGQNSAFSLTDAYNTQYQSPNWNVDASVLQGSPSAFILDNPVMQDITQIMGAGLRMFQSAPNGDFIAFFPDYYGAYGTQPSLDISPVEIIDFQIYHDDTQLVTHVAVIGDTNGIGQQVSSVDSYTTQGIVSIQDITTMQILFGKNNATVKNIADNEQNVIQFLNRYGLRPMVSQQSVIHSNALEYIYALQTFMQSWVNQFVSTVSLTFMPELYPGMRVSMTLDNEDGGIDKYEFFVTSVQHQGDRTGGFSTTASLTAPIKNGEIMHYGLNFVS